MYNSTKLVMLLNIEINCTKSCPIHGIADSMFVITVAILIGITVTVDTDETL